MAKSHSEDRRYLWCFHPCNEILMSLYEIFKTSKKQDLTPLMSDVVNEYTELTFSDFFLIIIKN
jgi:hypothetical protein